jgi:hypothetical protein
MVNNDAGGYKECEKMRCAWKWRGTGPYALQFIARDPGWENEGLARSKRILVFLEHKGWYLPDEQARHEILQRRRIETQKLSPFKAETFPRP